MAFENERSLTFLCTAEQGPILLQAEVDLNQVCTREQLHNHARCDDWTNTELHKSTAIRSENDTHPVERVRRVGGHDAIERNLRANKEDKESDCRP